MKQLNITDVRSLPGDSAFLIDDGKTAVLYDSGFAFTGYAVADNIKKVLGERNLDYIFLTHSHYDHALGSAYVLKYWPKAKVVAGEYAAKIFQKPSAKAVMRDMDRKFAVKCGVTDYEDLIDDLKVDIPVKDGDVIDAGDMRFTAVNLPGHTKCSVGFYLSENKLLLSTETIGIYAGDGVIFPSYLVGYGMALASIERVETMDIERILLPHHGLLDEKNTAFYLRNAKKSAVETAAEIAAILRNGGSEDEAASFFKEKYYHGGVKTIYPKDALDLNTGIMVRLIKNELVDEVCLAGETLG